MEISKANILIDETYHARLADFGLLTIISETTNLAVPSSSFRDGGTCRWMSPELVDEFGVGRRTEHSDCYAFGMVIYEVLSGELPFSSYADLVVILKVAAGRRPERPQGLEGMWFTDDIWSVLEHCWDPVPGNRPSIPEVLRSLKKWTQPSPQSLALADPVTEKPPIRNSEPNSERGTDKGKSFPESSHLMELHPGHPTRIVPLRHIKTLIIRTDPHSVFFNNLSITTGASRKILPFQGNL